MYTELPCKAKHCLQYEVPQVVLYDLALEMTVKVLDTGMMITRLTPAHCLGKRLCTCKEASSFSCERDLDR